jgi:hypothetical protein
MDDWAPEFKGFFNSPLGKELIRSLKEDLHDTKVSEAQKAENADNAFGLLKESRGVMLAIEHMMFLSAVPIVEDSKV